MGRRAQRGIGRWFAWRLLSVSSDGRGPSLPAAQRWVGRLVRGRPGRLATAGRMGVRARRIRH